MKRTLFSAFRSRPILIRIGTQREGSVDGKSQIVSPRRAANLPTHAHASLAVDKAVARGVFCLVEVQRIVGAPLVDAVRDGADGVLAGRLRALGAILQLIRADSEPEAASLWLSTPHVGLAGLKPRDILRRSQEALWILFDNLLREQTRS